MNFEQCIEPLKLVFLVEIDTPLSIIDIGDALLLAKETMVSMTPYTVDEYINTYASTMHVYFDLSESGVVSQLQLRGIVATVKNIALLIQNEHDYTETLFNDVIEMIPHMFYEGFEDDRTSIDKQQLKLRLAGLAPTYKLHGM